MHHIGEKLKPFLISAVVVGALAAFASSASASELTAKFSPSGSIKATTTGITVKRNGTDARTCTPETGSSVGGSVSENVFTIQTGYLGEVWFKCTGSTFLQMNFYSGALFDTNTSRYFLVLPTTGGSQVSPWGSYFQGSTGRIDPTWVNGSGSTKSVLKFENKAIGYAGGTITVTGNLEVATSAGGLVTLSH